MLGSRMLLEASISEQLQSRAPNRCLSEVEHFLGSATFNVAYY